MAPRLFYLLFSVSLLFSFRAQAQVYEPGWLVRTSGDTLRGEIENGFWEMPPTFIRFRTAASSPSQLFQPYQLRAVSFAKGRYFRYEAIPVDHAAETRLDKLREGIVHSVQIDSLLAEVLIEGPTMLWRVAQLGAVHFLVRRPGQPVLEMSAYNYLRANGRGALAVTDGNNYRSQLQQYFGDCPAAAAAAEKVPYTADGLVAVVQAYYAACAGGQFAPRTWLAPATQQHKAAFQAGVLAGARYNRIESPSYLLAGTCTDCGVHPLAGFYAELLQANRTSAFYGELSVSRFRNRGVLSSYYNTYTAIDYQAWLGTARIGVRFFAPLRHDQQLLFSFGLEHNFIFSSSATSTTEDLGFAAPTLLPNFGVGWRYQRLTLNLDQQFYKNQSGLDFSDLFFSSSVAVRLSVGYRLGRGADAPRAARLPQP